MDYRWVKWAVGEAGFRSASMTLMKIVGSTTTGFSGALLTTFVVGTVQVLVAATALRLNVAILFRNSRDVWGSVIFGLLAFIGTVLPIIAYTLGGIMPVYTFLTLLAIVPGALIDQLFFS